MQRAINSLITLKVQRNQQQGSTKVFSTFIKLIAYSDVMITSTLFYFQR